MRIGIDIGGTFTDFVLFDEASGQFTTHKTLSTYISYWVLSSVAIATMSIRRVQPTF